MQKLSKLTIDFCGEPRHFKRCPTKTLKQYTKGIEDIQKEIRNKAQDARGKEIEADNMEAMADTKEDKTEKAGYLEKAKELREEAKAIDKEIEDNAPAMEEEMIKKYGELCSQILEPFTPEDFEENYDSRDMALINSLGALYNMYMSNFSEIKIEARIQQIIEGNIDQRMSAFQSQ